MFDSIILLTGPSEQAALSVRLRQHNFQLRIHSAQTLQELEAIEPSVLFRSRLVAFVTPVVVQARTLNALGFGAYNFHPGPPQYPGWMPAHFAVHDHATKFGVTAHVMIERVDAGPIVGCELFDIPQNIGVLELEQRAFVELARLFWRLSSALATQSQPLPQLPIQWSGRRCKKRLLAQICKSPADVAEGKFSGRTATPKLSISA